MNIGDKLLNKEDAVADIGYTLISNGFCVSDMYDVDKANCERLVELNNEVYERLNSEIFLHNGLLYLIK